MRLKYAAKTRDGLTVKRGEIDAPDRDSAVRSLRERNLVVYSLTPVKTGINLSSLIHRGKIPLPEKVKFTDQLASMISAGLPLTKSLELLVLQTKDGVMSETTQTILNEVESGSPLAKAMENRGEKAFSKSYVNLVKAGEASGKLDEVLQRLADSLEKDRQFRGKVTGALIYPAIVVTAMATVFILIVTFLIPQMTQIYESFGTNLPLSTRILIWMSNFITNWWWIAILLLIGIVSGLKFFLSTYVGKYYWTKLSFKMPIFGQIIVQSLIVEFTRTLGLLTQAGVPLVEALEIVRDGMSNVIYKKSVENFIEDVKHGYPLSQAIAKEETFPILVSQMLMVGEETGTVDQRFNSLAKYYEGEVDKVVRNLSTAMEPIIMIMLGILVGLLVISVILPIYQLTTSL